MNIFLEIIHYLFDLIFPVRCLSCNISGDVLCSVCAEKYRNVSYFKDLDTYSTFLYRDPVIKKAVFLFKFNGIRKLSKVFADNIYKTIKNNEQQVLEGKNYYIIPVPSSKVSVRKKGYQPNVLICNELVKLSPSFVFKKDILINNSLYPQTKISNRENRINNIKGKILIKNNDIKNKNIILIDDVYTTGATLIESRSVLFNKGAKSVKVFVIAH